jgi:hypothetical protein
MHSGTKMTVRSARCHCGELELICHGEPRRISMCHCRDCQRRTGSAFSVAAFYERAQVSIGGGASGMFERDSASGFPVRFHFCRRCGANVYWEAARMPELLGVAVGAFADAEFPAPEQSVWTQDKHTWISLPPEMTTYESSPPRRSQPR